MCRLGHYSPTAHNCSSWCHSRQHSAILLRFLLHHVCWGYQADGRRQVYKAAAGFNSECFLLANGFASMFIGLSLPCYFIYSWGVESLQFKHLHLGFRYPIHCVESPLSHLYFTGRKNIIFGKPLPKNCYFLKETS